jgi:heme-degrading monooxygenase HmoA
VHARVATFEGDPAHLDEAITMVRGQVEAGEAPPGLEDSKMLMLVDRASGKGLSVTLYDSEEAMRRGDEALNAMTPSAGGRRTAVEFYEVPVQTVS